MMDAKEILDWCTFYTNMNLTMFCRKLGIDELKISKLIKDENALIPDEVIDAICEKYPEISRNWLRFGVGEMFNDVGINRMPTIDRGGYKVIDFYGNNMKEYRRQLMEREKANYKNEINASREGRQYEGRILELEAELAEKDKRIADLLEIIDTLK